eukprot:gene3893-4859_t
MTRMIKIGLTGGIASGKSTILSYLKELGVKCIDADKIGHAVYQKGRPSYYKLISEFGNDIINKNDESIDRSKLGPIVFSNSDKMKQLTSIVWPEMKELILNEFNEISIEVKSTHSDQPIIVVLEAAVLIESGFIDLVDKVWVSVVPTEVAVERIQTRNNLSREDALRRINSQISNQERIDRADVVFNTDNPDYQVTKNLVIQEYNKLLFNNNNQ